MISRKMIATAAMEWRVAQLIDCKFVSHQWECNWRNAIHRQEAGCLAIAGRLTVGSSPNGPTVSRYVACPLDGPSIVLLEHDHTDEANDDALIGEDADIIETYSLKSYLIETCQRPHTVDDSARCARD